jgi:hypothetical protein
MRGTNCSFNEDILACCTGGSDAADACCISFGTLAEPMSWGSLLQSKVTLLFDV